MGGDATARYIACASSHDSDLRCTPVRCIGSMLRWNVDADVAPGTSSIFQESLSKVGGSTKKSTDTSSDEGTVDTVDGVPKADSVCLPAAAFSSLYGVSSVGMGSMDGLSTTARSCSPSNAFRSESLVDGSTLSSILPVDSRVIQGFELSDTVYPISNVVGGLLDEVLSF